MERRSRFEARHTAASATCFVGETRPSMPAAASGPVSSPAASRASPIATDLAIQSAGDPLATVEEWITTRAERRGFCGASGPSDSATQSAVFDPLSAIGLRVGALVDHAYRIERALGFGGMGCVALATDERLDRHVAIKFIKPELFALPEMRRFFHDEARAMARVGHRNVLSVFAFGEHEEAPYFVMEYIDGKTVDQWLRARPSGTFPDLDEAAHILEQACLGVEAIHATSTVHRDLKPSNLLIDRSFRVAVGDLGVARILDATTRGNAIVGSASYMAPEAALGEDEAPEFARSRDLYALGCIAFELFTGLPPFVGLTDMNVLSQHILNEPVPPSSRRASLPQGFDDVILKALAKDPRKRFADVAAFRAAVMSAYKGKREPERILIADDDDDWRTVIVSSLRERFPTAAIDEFRDGESAFEAFQKHPYSVVLADLRMPHVDGARLTRLIREAESSTHTPIIVLTAAGGPRDWEQLAALGADAFLLKPVNADDVEGVIRRTIRPQNARADAMPRAARTFRQATW